MARGADVPGEHGTASLADIAALLGPQSPWTISSRLEGGMGYKDNVLLSPTARDSSGFARAGLELFVWRLPQHRIDYVGFLNAESTRYFSAGALEQEGKVYAQAEARYQIDDVFKVAVGTQGYHLDEVFDVSDTDVQRLVAELKVTGFSFGPTVRWAFHPAWWIETRGVGKREKYEDGANDARIEEGELRLGWRWGEKIEVALGGAERRRRFDRRPQYSVGGQPFEDTRLAVSEREGKLSFDVVWDDARSWKTTTDLSLLEYEDNGSGYFNYREQKVAQQVQWKGEHWLVELVASAGRLDFEVQTVGFGFSPPARIKDEFSAAVRVERELSEKWTVWALYGWERSRSNDRLASYRVNEGLLGVRWSWEK